MLESYSRPGWLQMGVGPSSWSDGFCSCPTAPAFSLTSLHSARLADKGGYRRTRTRRDIWTRGLKLFALLPIELRGHVVYSAIRDVMMHSRKSYRESERFVCRTRCRSVSGNRANNI